MERKEIAEQAAMIGIMLAWLVRIFTAYNAAWFHALIYYAAPAVLVLILVFRWRRMNAGFEFSRKIVDEQHRLTGANVLGAPRAPGPQSPYPGVVLPKRPDQPGSGPRSDAEKK